MSTTYHCEAATRPRMPHSDSVTGQSTWWDDCPADGPVLRRQLRFLPDGTVAGTSCAAPRPMLWHGQPLRTAVLFGFDVAPGHRSLGPALLLMGDMMQAAAEPFDLVYSFPTEQAIAMGRRAGHRPMPSLIRLARVLHYRHYLEGRLPAPIAGMLGWCIDRLRRLVMLLRILATPRCRTSWAGAADDLFDALWAESRHDGPLVRVHDTAMAQWRFDASPFAHYRYLLLHDKRRDLVAWFACRPDGPVLHVDDAWSRGGTDGMSHGWVLHLLQAAWKEGYESVSFCLSGSEKAFAGWRRAGFRPRESRPILGRWLKGEGGAPHEVYLTAADEDQ